MNLQRAHSSSELHMLQRLVKEVSIHPYKDELIEIMYQQTLDEAQDITNFV